MCGIVGLLVKKPALRERLGALMVPMLTGMTERGPDSAGLAVYTQPVSAHQHKISLYSGEHAADWPALLEHAAREFSGEHAIAAHGNQAVLTTAADADRVVSWLKHAAPTVAVLSVGQSTDLAVLQNEAYLAQARSTEIAARSNWKKAQIELDRALGDLLEKNHVELDDAVRGKLP